MLSIGNLATVALLLSSVANASPGGWFYRGEADVGQPTLSISRTSEQNVTLTKAMANVQEILRNIETSPSCKRKAAKSLVDACVKYDHKDPANTRSTDVELEDFQKLYGIRMSNCELEDAAQPLPNECNDVLHAPTEAIRGTHHIKTCLDAFYQDTNLWTTYQSMKTNALLMCQAMRVENDKDEQLHFFQVIITATSNISEVLKENAGEVDKLAAGFSGITDSMVDFRRELHKDNRELRAAIKESWDSIHQDMSGVSGDIQGLLRSMSEANDNLYAYTTQVDDALTHATDLSMQLDSQWATELAKIKAGLKESRDRYQFELELHLAAFHQKVFVITNSMETANDLSSDLLGKLTILSDDLDIPLEKASEIAIQADHVKAAQTEMFIQLGEKVTPLLDDLVAAGEHAASFSAWVGLAAGLLRNFLDKILPTIRAFVLWYSLVFIVVFMGCRKILALATRIVVSVVVTFAFVSKLATSLDPFELGQALVNSHPAFFRETPPYLSMIVVFLAGMSTITLVQVMRRSREVTMYDPATRVETLPQFQDDLDLHEQELKEEYYQIPY